MSGQCKGQPEAAAKRNAVSIERVRIERSGPLHWPRTGLRFRFAKGLRLKVKNTV